MPEALTKDTRFKYNPAQRRVYERIVQEAGLDITPEDAYAITMAKSLMSDHDVEQSLKWASITREVYDRYIEPLSRVYPKYYDELNKMGCGYNDIGDLEDEVEIEPEDDEDESGTVRILVTIGREQHERLKAIKSNTGRPVSAMVSEAVDDYLDKRARTRAKK